MNPQAPLTYRQENAERYIEEMIEFLQIPSVSTQPQHAEDMRTAAEWVANQLFHSKMENIELLETGGHPMVYADWLHAGKDAPTVLFYGHYDVQPAEPFELWETPPFEPTIKEDGYIYGRGTSDDKGQMLIQLKAVEAVMQTVGKLPINVKFLYEGEEESGGQGIIKFVNSPEGQAKIKADICFICDSHMPEENDPAIIYGLRGMCAINFDLIGPSRDIHSGTNGGIINNPLNVMGHVIASLKDINGTITIDGFYDDVRPMSDEERTRLGEIGSTAEQFVKNTGAPAAWGEAGYSVVERLGAREQREAESAA